MARPKADKPHDSIVKDVFGDPDNALVILRAALPAELVEALDPKSFKVEPIHFLDEDLRHSESDLLFTAKLREAKGQPGTVFVYVLIEHQSTVHPLMPYRVLRYVVRVWERWVEENPRAKKLPAVLPVVLHQGRSRWDGPLSIRDVVDVPEPLVDLVAKLLPSLTLTLDDLGALSLAEVEGRKGPPLATLALSVLRAVSEPVDLISLFERLGSQVQAVRKRRGGPARLRRLFTYAQEARPDRDPTSFAEELGRVLGPAVREVAMSTLRELKQQSHAEGRRSTLARQLRARFGDEAPPLVEKLEGATPKALDRVETLLVGKGTDAEALARIAKALGRKRG